MLCLMQQKPGTNIPLPGTYTFPGYHFLVHWQKKNNYSSCGDGHRASKGTGKNYSFCLWIYGFGWCRWGHMQVVNFQKTHLTCTNTNICTSRGFPWLRNPHIYIMSHWPSEAWSEFFLRSWRIFWIWALQQCSDCCIPCHTELDKFSTESYRTDANCSLAW